MSWWFTDFWVPIITTALGAGIGGYIAYLIAKRNYAYDKEAEGEAYLSLIIRQIKIVKEKGEVVKDCIVQRGNKEAQSFVGQLNEAHQKLEYELTLLLRNWEQFSEAIMLGGLTQICMEEEKRKRNEAVVTEITKMCTTITVYEAIAKRYLNEYEKNRETKRQTLQEFLQSRHSDLDQAVNLLRDLSESARAILEQTDVPS